MATPYSNYSLPQLYKMLTDILGTGDIARAAEVAENIGNISGIDPDSVVQRAMRDAEGLRMPSLHEQAQSAQRAADTAKASAGASRFNPSAATDPLGIGNIEAMQNAATARSNAIYDASVARTARDMVPLERTGLAAPETPVSGLDESYVLDAMPDANLLDALKPEHSPSQYPYVFGASEQERDSALLSQLRGGVDQSAVKNAARLQKRERRHPSTGIANDDLLKHLENGGANMPLRTGFTDLTPVPSEELAQALNASAATPSLAQPSGVALPTLAEATALPALTVPTPALLAAPTPMQVPTPTSSVESALQELAETASTSPAKRASRRVLSGRAPVAATAPAAPTPVAATPTPQLVQELSTPTPTPVVDPKPLTELADDIPGASALGDTVPGAAPTAGATPKRTITFGKLPKVGSPDTPAKGLKGLHKSLYNTGTSNTLNGLNASKTASIGKAGAKGGIGDFFAKFRKSNTLANPAGTPGKSGAGLSFTKGKGLSLGGSNALATLGTAAAIGGGVVNGLSNLKAASDEDRRTDDLSSDIIIAAASNPMATYGLTPDQLKTLGDVRSGRIDKSVDLGDIDWGSALSGGLTGALTGAAGGIPGAIAGGIAGLAGGGLGGFSQSKARKNAELDALYQALNQSNTNYQNAMRNRLFERYF